MSPTLLALGLIGEKSQNFWQSDSLITFWSSFISNKWFFIKWNVFFLITSFDWDNSISRLKATTAERKGCACKKREKFHSCSSCQTICHVSHVEPECEIFCLLNEVGFLDLNWACLPQSCNWQVLTNQMAWDEINRILSIY